MSRNRRRRPELWGLAAIGALVGFLSLIPLPFEILDNPRTAVLRMVLIGPVWLSLGIGIVLRFNPARVATQWLLGVQLIARCILLLFFVEHESLWTLGWFVFHAVASLGVLEYLRQPGVRAAFTGEEEELTVVELEPVVWQPEPEPNSTAFFRDPSQTDRYNKG